MEVVDKVLAAEDELGASDASGEQPRLRSFHNDRELTVRGEVEEFLVRARENRMGTSDPKLSTKLIEVTLIR